MIKFYPDATIFKETTVFDYKTILLRMRQQAYLTKGIQLDIIDERNGQDYRFYFE
jgi:DNA gyrase subunit B